MKNINQFKEGKDYSKSIILNHYLTSLRNIGKFAIWGTITISFILIIYSLVMFHYLQAEIKNIDAPFEILSVVLKLFTQIFILVSSYQFVFVLLAFFWALTMISLWFTVNFVSALILEKIGLRKKRYFEYFQIIRGKLTPKYTKVFVVLFLAAAICIIAIMITGIRITYVGDVGFIITMLFVALIFLLKYIFEWRELRAYDPNILRIAYGKKASIGGFIVICLAMTFIALVFRFGIPVLFLSVDAIGSGIFTGLLRKIMSGRDACFLNEYLFSFNGQNLEMLFSKVCDMFSLTKIMLDVLNKFGLSLEYIANRILHYLFWIFVTSAAFSLLIPMALYNWLLSTRKALKKVILASLVGLIGGFLFQWGICWLFLFPLPKPETGSIASLLIFTFYINWIYAK